MALPCKCIEPKIKYQKNVIHICGTCNRAVCNPKKPKEIMKELLTIEDFYNLKVGQHVVRVDRGYSYNSTYLHNSKENGNYFLFRELSDINQVSFFDEEKKINPDRYFIDYNENELLDVLISFHQDCIRHFKQRQTLNN